MHGTPLVLMLTILVLKGWGNIIKVETEINVKIDPASVCSRNVLSSLTFKGQKTNFLGINIQ